MSAYSITLSVVASTGARELRTATNLAALWAEQGRRDDARAILQPVFDQFTEGLDIADLKAAGRRLLTTLA
jgi:predicted ATPase